MSFYLCDVHHARISGALEGIRITVLDGGLSFSRKMRVCPSCHDDILRDLEKTWELLDGNSDPSADLLCGACIKPSPDDRLDLAVFGWSYSRNQPEHTYYGRVCRVHGDELVARYGLESGG